MLKDKAIYFYEEGYNCSQCILKACEQVYRINLPNQCLNMCSGISTGFGTGSICSIIVAGIMVFGIIFDEQTTKRLRMEFLAEFQTKHKSINCSVLRNEMNDNSSCKNLVGEVADIIEKIINYEKGI